MKKQRSLRIWCQERKLISAQERKLVLAEERKLALAKERKLVLAMVAAISIVSGLAPQADAVRRGQNSEKFYRSPSSVHGKTVLIPIGTHIEGRINSTISSNKSQQGEKFTIEITSPILANNVDVIIPSGSRISGEVVEAIPASKIPHHKGDPKPFGKLRTQLTSLSTPDGMNYPMVASMAGEFVAQGRGRLTANEEIGAPNMGYVGSQASFNAVHPGVNTRGGDGYGGYNRGPKVVGKKEYFKDAILGADARRQNQRGMAVISSIKKKGHDIYILTGSPLRIRIDAPLKIGMAAASDNLNIDTDPAEEAAQTGGRRFQRQGAEPETPPPEAAAAAAAAAATPPVIQQIEMPDPEGHLPAFLRTNRQKTVQPQRQMPFQQSGRPVPPNLLPTQRQWGATGTVPLGGGAGASLGQPGNPDSYSSQGIDNAPDGGRGKRFSPQGAPQGNPQGPPPQGETFSSGADDDAPDGGPPGGFTGAPPQGTPGFGGAPQNAFGGPPPAGFGSPGAYGGSMPSQGAVGMPTGMNGSQGAGNQGSAGTPGGMGAPQATPGGQAAAAGQPAKAAEKKPDPPKGPQPKDQLPPGLDW